MPERTPNHSPDPRSDGRIRPSANPDQSTSLSRQQSLADVRASIKSLIYKNLVASAIFPRLYADLVLHYAPNSPAAKILAPHYKKIVERTNQLMANVKSCTHIKVSGVRCGSPALRGEQFCYFHQRMLRTVRYPASRIRHAALLEDEESIQVALMETMNALLLGTIEIKRAELILRALNTAVRNARRVHFGLHSDDMVREIPDYPTPPLEQVDEQYAKELRLKEERAESARAREEFLAQHQPTQNKANPATSTAPTNASPASAATPNVSPTNVGTAAPGCPGGPEVSGRSAAPQKPTPTTPAEATSRKPSASVKQTPMSAKTQAPTAARKEAPRSVKTEDPASAGTATASETREAPKERKNAARGASRG